MRMLRIMKGQQKKSTNRNPKYKFGYKVPPSGRPDLEYLIDKKNSNNKWGIILNLELDNLWAWEPFEEFDPNIFKGIEEYQFFHLMMCFDVKFYGRHKSRLVSNGSRTNDLDDSIYSGVFSIRVVRLVIFLEQINGLSVCAADVSQEYLYSEYLENIYCKSGPNL